GAGRRRGGGGVAPAARRRRAGVVGRRPARALPRPADDGDGRRAGSARRRPRRDDHHRARVERSPAMTTTISPATTLAAIVTDHPTRARQLARLGLDYCCGGRRTLADACAERGLDPATVTTLLDAAGAEGPLAEWATLAPPELVDHIEATHHRYLHEELPRL